MAVVTEVNDDAALTASCGWLWVPVANCCGVIICVGAAGAAVGGFAAPRDEPPALPTSWPLCLTRRFPYYSALARGRLVASRLARPAPSTRPHPRAAQR